MNLLITPEITTTTYLMAFTAAMVVGVSKAGIKGIGIIAVTLMALTFSSKASTGILVPMLVIADIFAVIYYNKHTQWKYIIKFLPWMILGILIGVLIGKDLPEREFKWAMVVVIFISLGMLVFWDRRKSKTVPTQWLFSGSMGVFAGICTMIGNLAGAFTNIFFLAMRLPKNEFVGTAAWLFFITNLFKMPFHVFVWKTITVESLLINLRLLPAIFVGLVLGVFLVKKINEKNYKRFILIVTAIGAVAILFR